MTTVRSIIFLVTPLVSYLVVLFELFYFHYLDLRFLILGIFFQLAYHLNQMEEYIWKSKI